MRGVADKAPVLLRCDLEAILQVGLCPEQLVLAVDATAVAFNKLGFFENLGEYALSHSIAATGVEFIAKTEKPLGSRNGH